METFIELMSIINSDLDQEVIVAVGASLAVAEANLADAAANLAGAEANPANVVENPVNVVDHVKSAGHVAAHDHAEVDLAAIVVHAHERSADSHHAEVEIMSHHGNRHHVHVNVHDHGAVKQNVKSHDRHHANHQLAGLLK